MIRANPVPWSLGLAGLIPFWALAVLSISHRGFGLPAEAVPFALAAYAATIASFLGGMRWGLAVAQPTQTSVAGDYLLSVVPQLLAWAALALPDRERLLALGVLIFVLGPLDVLLVRRNIAPPWFGRLRLVLSVGAGLALFLAALG